MAPGPTFAATSGRLPRGDLAGRRHHSLGGPVDPVATDAESVSIRWQPVDRVATLQLHSGFAAAWHRLREQPPVLYLLLSAELADDARLTELVRNGIAVARLPAGTARAGLHR